MEGQKYLGTPVVIALITALSVVPALSTDMYLPALSQIVDFFSTTEATLNATLYGFIFMQAVGILLFGPVSDKFGRKPLLLGGIAVYIAASVLCSVAPTIIWFIALRCLQGFSAGCLVVIATALIKDCFADMKIRNTVLTMTVVFGIAGPVIAPILGAWLIKMVNWQCTLLIPAIVTLLCFVFILFLTEPLKKADRLQESVAGSLLHLPALFKNKAFTLFLASMGILTMPMLCFVGISSYIFVDGFGLSGTTYSYILGINAITGTILMIGLQHFQKKITMRRYGPVLLGCTLTGAVLTLLFAGCNPVVCLLCVLPMVLGSFSARTYTLSILLQQYENDTGSVAAVYNFVGMMFCCLGMFAGTLPWPGFITGLGIVGLIAGGVGVVLWIVLKADGMRLKGME
ncbi:MAG TPA: MFS transporter [Methanocorpusculum sp.]|nr:MFS transporter [Methanocorpusculum sp.]